MRYFFPKSARLLTRRQYQRISQQNRRFVGECVLVELRSNPIQSVRLGVTVTRRYGNAVQRNRFKRIVREAFRLSLSSLPPGVDINIKPRTAAYKAKTSQIAKDLKDIKI